VKCVVACLEGERSESEDASTGQVTAAKRRDTVKTIGGPRGPIPIIEPGLPRRVGRASVTEGSFWPKTNRGMAENPENDPEKQNQPSK